MAFRSALAALCLIGSILASPSPAPHEGMIDTPHHRDVGVVWTKPGYQGNPSFIFEVKESSECLPFNSDLVSIKICKTDVECTFYSRKKAHGGNLDHQTGGSRSNDPNCKAGPDNYALAIGCGDAPEVDTDIGNHFDYYTCMKMEKAGPAHKKIKTIPHNASKDRDDMLDVLGS